MNVAFGTLLILAGAVTVLAGRRTAGRGSWFLASGLVLGLGGVAAVGAEDDAVAGAVAAVAAVFGVLVAAAGRTNAD